MKKVAILTTFNEFDRAYSLCGVASCQIKMLLIGGYKPKVIVTEAFKDENVYPFSEAEIVKIPAVFCSNEGQLPDNWQEDARKLKIALREILKNVDVVCAHDITYQCGHLLHNVVSRELAEEFPKIKWLHWIHSATSPSILCNKEEVRKKICRRFPNSFIVYPNSYDVPRVARNFGVEEDEVKVVPHPIDVCEYLGFHEMTKKLVDEKDILSADIIGTYPLRMDRGKNCEMVVKVFIQLKKLGKKVRLIIANFHSTGQRFLDYKAEIKNMAVSAGLNSDELTFTSEYDKSLELSCPREMVRDLMLISNVFVLPSKSETYSLVAQESMLCRNFCILNFDFSPMRSIYREFPKYFQFSANINALTGYDGETTTRYSDEDGYFADIARYVIYELTNNRVLAGSTFIRKERNLKAVFRNFLEPLLYA